jgi:hypothetical protein
LSVHALVQACLLQSVLAWLLRSARLSVHALVQACLLQSALAWLLKLALALAQSWATQMGLETLWCFCLKESRSIGQRRPR